MKKATLITNNLVHLVCSDSLIFKSKLTGKTIYLSPSHLSARIFEKNSKKLKWEYFNCWSDGLNLVKEIFNKELIEKEKTNAFKEKLIPGSILVSSWGSEQTNVSFYQVISSTAKTVTLREIEKYRFEEDMRGWVTPKPNEFIGPAFRKKIESEYVQIGNREIARLLKFTDIDETGTKVYERQKFTSYA
ncbi:hypothetical protein [Acinetobacter baumannii]|uniref:hypothetical protein n=2 Tax=Acinetobacter baumannii TaxID=470 RepID=UPI00189AE84B|nr:hypothetical protein [Acinetobacter baumannii]MBF6956779.1 hypothetical protein [Acinetobacter baumannii]